MNVKTAAFCALAMMASPAAAEPWGFSFGFYGGYRPPVSAADIHAVLGSNGLRPIGPPVQTGRYVVVRAVDSSGEVVRVLLNARFGNIVEVSPLPSPPAPVPGGPPNRPYESYGTGPYEPYGQPNGSRPYEPYGQPNGSRPYEPYGQADGSRPYEPYGQPNGTRPYEPYGTRPYPPYGNRAYEPNEPYGQASAARPDLKSEPAPPPFAPNGQSMIPPPGRSTAALTTARPPLPRPRPATTVARAAPAATAAPAAAKPAHATGEAPSAAPSAPPTGTAHGITALTVPGKPSGPAAATKPAATAATKPVPEPAAAPAAPPTPAAQAGDTTGSAAKKPAESFPPAAPLE